MFLKNVWYVAAWSHEVPQQGVLSRKLLGENVVLYRTADGSVVALMDRCPHRAAPLSLGRREGDALRCMYHGLLFDSDGTCVDVPGSPRVPPGLTATTYPIVEQDRYVWIWMGEASAADPTLVPNTREHSDPNWHYNPGYLHYGQASYLLIMDNLLDFSHLGFVHEDTLGGGRYNAEGRSHVERFDWGLRITRKYANVPLAPFLRNVATFSGLVDRWQIYDWRVAGNQLVMSAGSAPVGTGALEGHYVPEAVLLKSIQSLTPETESGTHYFWMLAHNVHEEAEALSAEIERQTVVAFDEDRRMIEAQQAILMQYPDTRLGAIPADAALNQGRWLLQRMLDREAALPAASA